ncbi:MAG TPA: metallophosphoesterase, partial [Nocardioidaceae bacterium]|nr:metallophosphoesterase [Nocardioidaceae bacterium]
MGSGSSRWWRPALVALVLFVVAAGCLEGIRPWAGDPGTGPGTVLQAGPGRTFLFTAAGDYGTSNEAAATLESIGRGEAAFHLALGDLSYGGIKPETAWCEFVRSRVGPDRPFQLLAGNHDSDGEPEGGHIDAFRTCLPNRIDGVVGQYARQYYFDYPR